MAQTGDNENLIQNALETALSPIDVRSTEVVFGAAEYVAFEVFTDALLRWMFKFQKRGLMETAVIHAVSIPFIGGAAGFLEGNHVLGYEAPAFEIAKDGAKGLPGLCLAQYVVNTAYSGYHFPKVVFKDVMILMSAKVLTRFVVSFAYPFMNDMLKNNLDTMEAFFFKQRIFTRLQGVLPSG